LSIDRAQWQGRIVDFASINNQSLSSLIQNIIDREKLNGIFIYNFSPLAEQQHLFRKFGFKFNIYEEFKKRFYGREIPIFIRLISEQNNEKDWLIEDMDLRKIENWDIKEIVSDSI